ncbi:putative ATPase/DNA-binding SARP family transcriptional activator [Streptomyces sp. V4I23]|uniref:BTAD domain-containing putative transcriptional regulator n=1 Tax=Streptomyces sp. V4I23 TaxID=3042282 RepID=UPI002781AC78|nr:BTAD domain-containing putative transcriptional regulator [Streptomyces sp. V4I23]MDQ1005940.1 putative ATPase/DNA-binding SARP family transcriptional activator [Streptomyces sp. V4I23]
MLLTSNRMEYRFLGPVQAWHAGVEISLGPPRHRAVLAVLLAHVGEIVSVDQLIWALWGEHPPAQAVAMLHVRMSRLRKALSVAPVDPHTTVVTRGAGYVLAAHRDQTDAYQFERLTLAGRRALARGESRTAASVLREGLALWKGQPFGTLADEPFAQTIRARLESLRLDTLEARIEADIQAGLHRDVIPELVELTCEHPLRERLWGHLMLSLVRAGRQGEALQTYQTARQQLVDLMGIEPGPELRDLQAAILHQNVPPAHAEPYQVRHAPLPRPQNDLVGREAELEQLVRLTRLKRLVTVTGPSGVGKSRMILEVANVVGSTFHNGVVLIVLGGLEESDSPASRIAAALGVREPSSMLSPQLISQRLRGAELLLGLDDCEHHLEDVFPIVNELLDKTDGVHVLATGREPLGLPGEQVFRLAGLAVPQPTDVTADGVSRSPSAQLFAAQAGAAGAGFRLTDANAADVARVCRSLGGLPLPISLAASRVRGFDVAHIADRLDAHGALMESHVLFGPFSDYSLPVAIEGSYDSLPGTERRLFRRLAVFDGGFTLEAAQAVCGDEEPVSAPLARLVGASLVSVEGAAEGGCRYRLKEAARAYASRQLWKCGETAWLSSRHAIYFGALAAPPLEDSHGPALRGWAERPDTELDNFRAALRWSMGQGVASDAVSLAGYLSPFWDVPGRLTEARLWLASALALQGPVPPRVRARALLGASWLAIVQDDPAAGMSAAEQAQYLFEELGEPVGATAAVIDQGLAALVMGAHERAEELLRRGLSQAQAMGNAWLEQWSLFFTSLWALDSGRVDEAEALITRATVEQTAAPESQAWLALVRSAVAYGRGELPQAAASLRECIRHFRAMRSPWGLAVAFLVAGQIVGSQGNHHRAVNLSGAAEKLRTSVDIGLWPTFKSWDEEVSSRATKALGPTEFGNARSAGRRLCAAEATERAEAALRWIEARKRPASKPPAEQRALRPVHGVTVMISGACSVRR